jgi:hypothetical protein
MVAGSSAAGLAGCRRRDAHRAADWMVHYDEWRDLRPLEVCLEEEARRLSASYYPWEGRGVCRALRLPL